VVAGGVEVVVRDLGVVLGVLALGVLHGECRVVDPGWVLSC
jgi:hypothetical protein